MSKLPLQPLDIAREALRQLALRRIPPTPDSFRELYHEIAGTPPANPFPSEELRRVANALPRSTPERVRIAAQIDRAVESEDWNEVKQAIAAALAALPEAPPPWATMLGELLAQLDASHQNLTRARKLAAIEHVLTASASNPELLFNRLNGLTSSWLKEPLADPLKDRTDAPEEPAEAAPAVDRRAPRSTAAPAAPETDESGGQDSFAHWLAMLLRRGVLPLLSDNVTLSDEVRALAEAVERDAGDDPPPEIGTRLRALGAKLEWAGEDQRAVRAALLSLLRLIVDNISELVIDDQWLHGQVEALGRLFDRPLDIRALDELERRLRDVIDKQKHLKRQLTDAQERLKSMLAGFVDKLAGLSESTGHYHDTLTECASRLREAGDFGELSSVIENLIEETRTVQETARRSSEEIGALRDQVDAANTLISRLQRELDETSELVRYDPLTGVLNRKGLDEALSREIARARQRSTVLCVGLLDLDNFKQLNDTFGHRTGDEALRHLADVARGSLRQQDIIGRIGGEEFLVLLPDADEEQATQVMTRLQRQLTKHIFLADNSRVLITFSAGISRITPEDTAHDAIDRADKAMYAAKRAGKNRVFVAA